MVRRRLALAIVLGLVSTSPSTAPAGILDDAPEAVVSSTWDMLEAEQQHVPSPSESSPTCSLRLRWHVGIPQVKSPVVPNHYLVIARDEAEVIGTCVSDAPIDAAPVVKITFEYFDSRPGVQTWTNIADLPPCEDASQAGRPMQVLPCRAWDEYRPTWNEELQRAEDHKSVGFWHRAKFEMISPVGLGPYYSGVMMSSAPEPGDLD